MAADQLPSEMIVNILSRMPVKSLARFRSVSNVWREYIDDQYFKVSHDQGSPEKPLIVTVECQPEQAITLGLGVYDIISTTGSIRIGSILIGTTALVLKAENIQSLEIKCKKKLRNIYSSFLGCCNGLVYLTRDGMEHPSHFILVNPLRKEYYRLPRMDRRYEMKSGIHGLGFDDSTNTFKMVFFATTLAEPGNNIPMLHVFGTKSWRQISQVPPNISPMFTNVDWTTGAAVPAGGCLHWLADIYNRQINESEHKVISLDMRTEEFWLIDLPNKQGPGEIHYVELVDLNGEVGCVYSNWEHDFEVWVLKLKEWVIYCRSDHKPHLRFFNLAVLCCWNKDGDLLMKTRYGSVMLFIYYLKSGLAKEVKLDTKPNGIFSKNTFLYRSSLFSLRGLKAYSIKK